VRDETKIHTHHRRYDTELFVEVEMNERLRELADQARFAKTTDYPSQDEVFERFAKLIVLACSEVIRNDGYRSGPFGNIDLSPSEIAIMIEEHFGIKS
jgi:hypothetical protein